jgi:hypothetical protein
MPRKPHLLNRSSAAVNSASLAAVLVLAGCSHTTDTSAPTTAGTPRPSVSTWLVAPNVPPSAAAPSAAQPNAVRPTAEPDGAPPGTQTCAALGTAIKNATLMQPGIVDQIFAASATADAPVGDAAQRLATAYAAAAKSTGTAQEPDAVAAVSAAAADMDGVCNESGLESTG